MEFDSTLRVGGGVVDYILCLGREPCSTSSVSDVGGEGNRGSLLRDVIVSGTCDHNSRLNFVVVNLCRLSQLTGGSVGNLNSLAAKDRDVDIFEVDLQLAVGCFGLRCGVRYHRQSEEREEEPVMYHHLHEIVIVVSWVQTSR